MATVHFVVVAYVDCEIYNYPNWFTYSIDFSHVNNSWAGKKYIKTKCKLNPLTCLTSFKRDVLLWKKAKGFPAAQETDSRGLSQNSEIPLLTQNKASCHFQWVTGRVGHDGFIQDQIATFSPIK